MNTSSASTSQPYGRPPWFNQRAADLKLDEIAPILIAGSTCEVSVFSAKIKINPNAASPAELKVSRFGDFVMRTLVWLLAFSMFFIMGAVESLRLLPSFGGFWFSGCLLAFGATVLVSNINSNFESLVKVAVARAIQVRMKGDMVRETLGLFAILCHLRPWLSKYESLFVSWGNRANNMDLYALEPLKLALDLLWELDHAPGKSWQKQWEFDRHIRTVEHMLPKLENVWFKDLKLPLYLIQLQGAIAIAGAILWTAYNIFRALA